MATVTTTDLAGTLEELQAQVADLSQRLEAMERRNAAKNGTAKPMIVPVAAAAQPPAEAKATITEEELLAISAAIGAFLGVRAHIRQIRLLSSNAWAQQGRVSIQASHSLQG